MADFDRTITFDSLASMTLAHYYDKGVVHDAVFNSNPTFAKLFKKGLNVKAGGGSEIQTTLMYEGNSNVDSMGEWDTIPTAPQEGFTNANYQWAIVTGSIPVSNLEIFKNSGKAQIMSLVRKKVEQNAMTFSEEMNKQLWDYEEYLAAADGTTGNGGKDLVSIPLIVQGLPTDACDVGGIDQSVYTWWANLTANSATESSGTWQMFKGELMRLFHNCSKGPGGKPNLLVSDMATYEMYIKSMDAKIKYVYTDKDPSVGFEGISYLGAEWFWDYHVGCPDAGYNYDNASYALGTMGAVYMLNTKFLDLVVGKGKDFKPSKFVEPYNKDGRVAKSVFYGQLVCSNRKKQGVLEDITTTLTSEV